ncbi:HvfC family RiPP maturation protein [Shewanella psychrotolerans]|uniref:HvfC family RiPP maturation protein n=1 Tax=Shewanella psychrotolerans TaxID=2864206 RepID=UPI001C656961|nr:putative DNA-binding domain-containing protein [Shewanella psychrotolerans]QYK02899.1 putative DNA-binding domain-containing protein [Shewanella psychrotolerans]
MSFTAVQQSFIDHIRDPSMPIPLGTDTRRMKIYRELFFNNIKGFVSNAFPVLCSLYEEQQWEALVQQFFANHDCKTPIFIEIAGEFLVFLQHEYQPTEVDDAFMLELAHYEWLELLVATERDNPLHYQIDESDLDTAKLCVSASAKVAQYCFDVQRISPDYRPCSASEQPNFFCIYRDKQDEVCFLQLNPLTAQVLAYIEQNRMVKFEQLSQWLITTFTQIESHVLISGARQLLVEMIGKGIVKGYR